MYGWKLFTGLETVTDPDNGATQQCSDFLNCAEDGGDHVCDSDNGICHEVVGLGDDGLGYTCSCAEGWTVTEDNGRTCENENECTNGKHTCDVTNGICTDTDGSFNCTCNDGYHMGDDGLCADDNECNGEGDGNDCDANHGDCHNTVGSYTCSCNTGYEIVDGALESYNCTDTNECGVNGTNVL